MFKYIGVLPYLGAGSKGQGGLGRYRDCVCMRARVCVCSCKPVIPCSQADGTAGLEQSISITEGGLDPQAGSRCLGFMSRGFGVRGWNPNSEKNDAGYGISLLLKPSSVGFRV